MDPQPPTDAHVENEPESSDTEHGLSAPENGINPETARAELETVEADVAEPPRSVVRRGSTFESLRHRDFTLFVIGSLISNTGTWMQTAALAIVVWALRKSEFDLGLVNFMSGIPVLFLALPAGVLADRLDKRRLLMWAQGLLALQALALWALYQTGRLSADKAISALVWICGLGLIAGVLSALTFPAWQALLPSLVPRESLMNGIALNSAQFQSSRLLGPLAASGLLLLGATAGDIFLVNSASFLFVIAALWAIHPQPEIDTGVPPSATRAPTERPGPWATLTAGIRYAIDEPVVGYLILSTAAMTVLAMPYMMLLRAIAEKALGGGDLEFSWLMAANGLGALFGALAVASLPQTVNRERLIPIAIITMAVLLIAFSQSRSYPLSLVISTLAGAAFLTTNSLTNTSIQATVPGQLRGRVMALFVMSFMGIMPISSAIFGPLGETIGPTQAVLVGALLLFSWGAFLLVSGVLTKARSRPAGKRD